MIVTTIENKENKLYEGMNERFAEAFRIAKSVLTDTPEDGRHDVSGDELYYMIQSYDTKSPFEAKFESHREYIDVQMVISGEEVIRFESTGKLPPCEEYTFDYELYNMNKDFDSVRLCRGELAIIFPGELHAPCICSEGADRAVRKLVIKIKAD